MGLKGGETTDALACHPLCVVGYNYYIRCLKGFSCKAVGDLPDAQGPYRCHNLIYDEMCVIIPFIVVQKTPSITAFMKN